MTDLERAAAFEELIRDRCTERVVETRFGPALFNDTHSTIWSLNVLRADRPGDATAEEIAAEADCVQAKLAHRLAWEGDEFLFMVYRGGGEPAETSHVEEVESERIRPLREEIIREWQRDADNATVEQLISADYLMWEAANARSFAVVENGEVVSSAELFSDAGTAQVEEVQTLPTRRGQGHAKAVVTRAVEEALAAEHDFIFLVAAGDDWPKELYKRLGFEEVGSRFSFLKR